MTGLRHNAAGETLQLDLMTTAGDRTRELVEQVLQSQWKAIGADVRIKNEPARVLFGQTLSERQYSGLVLFAFLSSPENVPFTTLHSTMIPTKENGGAGQNYGGFKNPAFDDLIDCLEVRARPREARGDVASAAAALCRGAAGPAALFPLPGFHPAEMAVGRAADGPSIRLDPLVGGLGDQ